MTANRLAACIKPVIEGLESRQLMSVTITQFNDSEGHNTLRIRGDSKKDTVVITDDPANGQATVLANGNLTTWFYPDPSDPVLGEIEVFDADLKGGDDSLTFTTANDPIDPAYIGEPRALHLDGDTGNDKITLNIPGGITAGSDITVQIDGDSGNDTIDVSFDAVYNSKLDVDITAGDGNDLVSCDLVNKASGAYGGNITYASAVTLALDLGSGKNTGNVFLNADISEDSSVDIDVKGGNSTGSSFDTILIDCDNTAVEGKLFVDVAANAGDDKVTLSVDNLYVASYATDPSDPESTYYSPTAVFNLNGGDGKDTMLVKADNAGMYADEESFVSFAVRGGNGDDKITVNLSGPIDLRAGTDQGAQFVLNVDGQNNNDTIVTTLVFGDNPNINNSPGGGQADISIKGGQNTDKITFNASDTSTNGVFFGPSLYGPLIDGQTGTDTANVFTVGLVRPPTVRNFETSFVSNT